MLSATFSICVYNKWNLQFLCDDKSSWSIYRVSSILYIRVVILHHIIFYEVIGNEGKPEFAIAS